MSTLWRKALRDFWLERTRTALVAAAIALGIAAFSAVLSSYAILQRELNQGYLGTNPASFTIRTDRLDEELLRAVAMNPNVAAAEPRRVISGRIKAGPAVWRPLILFVVKDYAQIRVGTITPETGAWPPGQGEMLIERDAFQVAKAQIGDTVTVRTPKGDFKTLRVTGGVHDVGQAQARMENIVYGYITLETLADLGEDPFVDELHVLVSGDRFSPERIRVAADEIKHLFEARSHPVRRLSLPEPGKHPHADLMGLLLLAISSFGLLVLFLSGVLVVNLLTALMASQIRRIGMMKAVGGTRGQIARIYLGQALLLGLAAVTLAIPLGMVGARALCDYLARFLNFDITSYAVPFWVYALVGVIGVLTPLLAAARPVLKGSAVSVAAALAESGVANPTFGADGLERALTNVRGLSRPLLLAIRNSFRKRTRLALTVLTLSTAGVFFMSALNVRASMISTIDHLFAPKRFDVSVTLAAMHSISEIQAAIERAARGSRFEGWIASEGTLVLPAISAPSAAGGEAGLHGADEPTAVDDRPQARPFSILALSPRSELLSLAIGEGRDLETGDVDAMVVNSALQNRYPEVMRVGASVEVRTGGSSARFRVVGVSREAFAGATAYVSRGFFDRSGGSAGLTNALRVALPQGDASSIDRFRETFDRELEALGIRALSASSKADSRYGFDQHMLMIYLFQIVMSAIIALVGGLGLTTTMSLNVLERRKEMGVLRAIGASSPLVWLVVVTEGLTIGLISFLIASLVAGPLSRGLGDFIATGLFQTELNFAFDLNGVWIWFVVSLVLCAVASFIPAWNASRGSVRDALGFE